MEFPGWYKQESTRVRRNDAAMKNKSLFKNNQNRFE